MSRRSLAGFLTVMLAVVTGCATVPTPSPPASATVAPTSSPSAVGTPGPDPSPDSSPTPTPAPLASLTPEEIGDAVAVRTSMGLANDVTTVLTVAADPDADTSFGTPLTRAEVDELWRRGGQSDPMKPFLVRYGEDHPEEFAGLWIDQRRQGMVVVQFSANLDAHRRAIAEQFPGVEVDIRQVEWSHAELEGLLDAAVLDLHGPPSDGADPIPAWLRRIPARVLSSGVSTRENRIALRVSSPHPDVARIIEAHFGWHGKLIVETDGTGSRIPSAVKITVVVHDRADRPVGRLRCAVISDLVGDVYEGLMPGTDSRGECILYAPASGAWIRIHDRRGEDVLRIKRVVLVPGRDVRVAITVERAAA